MTYLYLDVDGVINAKMPYGWGRLDNKHVPAAGASYRIRWAPNMVSALAEMDLEVVWATSWQQWAPSALAEVIGFGAGAPYLEDPPGWWEEETDDRQSMEWKRDAVYQHQLEHPGPFIWVDNEIGESEILLAESIGGLAIATNERLGITPQQLITMKRYIEEHKEVSDAIQDQF